MPRLIAGTLLIASACFVLRGQTPATPGTPPDFRDKVGLIVRGVRSAKSGDRHSFAVAVQGLDAAIGEQVRTLLNATPTPRASGLAGALNEDLTYGMYGRTVAENNKFFPDLRFADAMQGAGEPPSLYVVAYSVPLQPGIGVAHVEGFVRGGAQYRLSTQSGEDLGGDSLHLIPLRATSGAEVRFLILARRAQDAHRRADIFEYRFDGNALIPLWHRSGLAEGEVRVRSKLLSLTYQDLGRWANRTPPYFVEETYRLTESGARLLSTRHANAPS